MIKRLKTCYLYFAFVVLVIGVYGGYIVGRSVSQRYCDLGKKAEVTRIWIHEATQMGVFSRRKGDRTDISLSRHGEEEFFIEAPNEERWDGLFVVPNANFAYALTKKLYPSTGYTKKLYPSTEFYRFSRLVQITLPSTNTSLHSVKYETLFTADDLRLDPGDNGMSWIESIEGATDDGSHLLLSRAIPIFDPERRGWSLRFFVYDVNARQFDNRSFMDGGVGVAQYP